ncbi:MAG: hypothetical protein AD742_16755 [Methylibium sp. NZG]|nr:MAG: hypothetical protein AD742_16755 [Methylibium sp. NZG]
MARPVKKEKESAMSITSTSLSFTFVNTYAAPAAKQTAPAERCAPAGPAARHSCDEARPASRPNRLVEAMMTALRELGVGNAAAQPAQPAATAVVAVPSTAADAAAALAAGQASAAAAVAQSAAATATATATTAASPNTAPMDVADKPQVSIESAVRQFAHELFSALRQMGRGESAERGADRVHGDGGRRHHHGHHGHHGWRREGYGDMAQRLNALSQTYAAPAAVGAAGGPASMASSLSITLTIQTSAVRAPAQAETTNAAVASSDGRIETSAATSAADVSATALPALATTPAAPALAASPVTEPARNPLLDAFSQLFGALKPQAAQTDMADKLRTFLQTLAQAMRPDSVNQGNPMPQVGALVNITA